MNTPRQSCFLTDEEATLLFGARLAQLTGGRGVLTFSGDLGSGKTTLCRGIIRSLGHSGNVKSPTYTLVETYEFFTGRVMHYDLYRLADPEEAEYLGMRDYLDDLTLTLIEWPEKATGMLPAIDLGLHLEVQTNGRLVHWESHTPFGHTLAAALRDLYPDTTVYH